MGEEKEEEEGREAEKRRKRDRKGFQIYEEMRKYLVIYEEAVSYT